MGTRTCFPWTLALLFTLGAGACQPAEDEALTRDELWEILSSCYPDLPPEAQAIEGTLEQYSADDFEGMDCNEIDDAGKADLFSFGGCATGEHVCSWLFCCEDDYDIHWNPDDEDWSFVSTVVTYQEATPEWALDELESASYQDLLDAVSVTFEQDVDAGTGKGPQELAIEITAGIIPVSFETFLERFSPDTWGVNLDHYLGGEVQVYAHDEQGRVLRQLERMVLSPFSCDAESPLSNQDMTKVEHIVYAEDSATVYWRVMYSDNDSTATDIGTVTFTRDGHSDTLVIFHSAHRLRTAIGTDIPNTLVMLTLAPFFSDHVREYREIVTGQR